MKQLLLLLCLLSPFVHNAQEDLPKELIANFYRTEANEIIKASEKFVSENYKDMFVCDCTTVGILPDSIKERKIYQVEEGFAIRGVIWKNDLKCFGDIYVVAEYKIQARDNRARVLITPVYYYRKGGNSDCPESGTIEDFFNCERCKLTAALMKDDFHNKAVQFRKDYKNKVTRYIQQNKNNW